PLRDAAQCQYRVVAAEAEGVAQEQVAGVGERAGGVADAGQVDRFVDLRAADRRRHHPVVQGEDRGDRLDPARGALEVPQVSLEGRDRHLPPAEHAPQGPRLGEVAVGVPPDEQLRLAFRWGNVPANAGEDPPAELKAAYDWLTTADRPVLDVTGAGVFEDVLYRIGYKLDGTPAAGDTYRRRRRALNTALEHAVVAGELPENPLQRARRKHVGSNDVVDRRVLVNAVQARQLLA